MRRGPYMYRYVAFIHPPKSTDPVSHAYPHISVLVLFLFRFRFYFFLFLLRCMEKLKQPPPTTSLRLAPVKRSLESVCRLLEIDRATYTVGECAITTNNDKPRQTKVHDSFLLMSCVYRKKKKKKHKLRVSYPIPSHRPRADFG